MLRSNYSSKLKQLMQEVSVSTDIRTAVDLGCSTGLSTLELHSAFPGAQVTALDLSPYFIAVANHDQQQRQVCAEQICLACLLLAAAAVHAKIVIEPFSVVSVKGTSSSSISCYITGLTCKGCWLAVRMQLYAQTFVANLHSDPCVFIWWQLHSHAPN